VWCCIWTQQNSPPTGSIRSWEPNYPWQQARSQLSMQMSLKLRQASRRSKCLMNALRKLHCESRRIAWRFPSQSVPIWGRVTWLLSPGQVESPGAVQRCRRNACFLLSTTKVTPIDLTLAVNWLQFLDDCCVNNTRNMSCVRVPRLLDTRYSSIAIEINMWVVIKETILCLLFFRQQKN